MEQTGINRKNDAIFETCSSKYWSQKALTAHETAFHKALNEGLIQYDVSLVLNKDGRAKEIRAVKAMLASISPVFKKEAISKIKARSCSIPRKIKKQGDDLNEVLPIDQLMIPSKFDYSEIECIVRYSFGVDPYITNENVYKMRNAANYYEVHSLTTVLDQYIEEIISNESRFCTAFHSICEMKDSDLIKKCLTKFQNHLNHKKVFYSTSFSRLSAIPDLKLLLQVERLNLKNEEVWERCKVWAKSQTEHTFLEALSLVKGYVKFGEMMPEYLMKNVYNEHILENQEYVDALALSICNTITSNGSNSNPEKEFRGRRPQNSLKAKDLDKSKGSAEDVEEFIEYLCHIHDVECDDLLEVEIGCRQGCLRNCFDFEEDPKTSLFLLIVGKLFCLQEDSSNLEIALSRIGIKTA